MFNQAIVNADFWNNHPTFRARHTYREATRTQRNVVRMLRILEAADVENMPEEKVARLYAMVDRVVYEAQQSSYAMRFPQFA